MKGNIIPHEATIIFNYSHFQCFIEQVVDNNKSLDINLLFETQKKYFILVFTVIKDYGTFYYLSDFAISAQSDFALKLKSGTRKRKYMEENSIK